MRRVMLAAVVLAVAFGSACDRKPPAPKVEWNPDDRQVMAGESIVLRATKSMAHADESFEYEWTMKGDCAGALAKPAEWKIEYEVPGDCAGGTLTFQLDAKTKLGTTSQTVEFAIAPQPKKEIGLLPVRPEPIPDSWKFVNDYEGTVVEKDQDRRNSRGGYFGTWTFRDGKCALAAGTDGDEGVLALSYVLPHNDLSACGYFEYFDGAPGAAKQADISAFEKIGFIARSESGEPIRLRLELVEFDKFANYDQGIVSESEPLVVDGEWRRHEVLLKKLASTWKLSSAKSVGFRIDAKDPNPGKGTVLIDNLVLIGPDKANPSTATR